jgi:cyclopropane-fatty-acyl-phospholipid synthase
LVKTANQAAQTTISLLEDLFQETRIRNFAVRLWDGTLWQPQPVEQPTFTLVLQHPGALRNMFLPPTEINWAEGYIYNDFDIEGNIDDMFPFAMQFLYKKWGPVEQMRYGARLLSLPKEGQLRTKDPTLKLKGSLHSRERDRQAVMYHYDQSNEFYSFILDSRMIYTGAYFAAPDEDLETAQERKLEYLCRKLGLRPGERVLDIGCGWGAFSIYAAQHYGVETYGVTLSPRQAEFAQKRIREEGLTDRCRVEVRDYRDVGGSNEYDKVASIGMFEHVGKKLLPSYFKQAWQLLKPGGVMLNHGISSTIDLQSNSGATFANRYVFPDGEMVPITTALCIAEEAGFEIRDLECIREHYTLTSRMWTRNLEAHAAEASAATSEEVYRIWRLLLSGLAYTCEIGRNTVYQALLVKPDEDGHCHLPLTRAGWYQ